MPACHPNPGSSYDSRQSTVTGWGTLASGSNQIPRTLFEVDVDTITNTACTTNTLYSSGDITGNMICARRSGKDSCQGWNVFLNPFFLTLWITRRLWRPFDHQGEQLLLLDRSRFLGGWLCPVQCSWCLLQGHKSVGLDWRTDWGDYLPEALREELDIFGIVFHYLFDKISYF